jgi:hypothetical protein
MRALILCSWLLPGYFIPARAQARASNSGSVTGTYVLDKRVDAGCTVEVAQLSSRRVRLQLACSRGAPNYNMGFLDERLPLRDREVRFQTTAYGGSCVIRLRFEATRAIVRQTETGGGGCGFGYGVDATGVYRRTSRRVPPFDLLPGPTADEDGPRPM